jgi:minichromosome maintenance protein 10
MKRVDEDRELKRLLERDKEGMAAVIRAREAALEMSARAGCDKDRKKASRSRDAPVQPKMAEDGKTSKSIQSDESGAKSYSANIIRHLGFDPAVKPGQRRCDDATVQDKVRMLVSIHSS